MACRDGNSERIVTDLRHDDLVVGLRCATDTLEGEALIVGILHAGFERAVIALVDRIVEPGGDLPDLARIAVAGCRR
jgi:hypothetical protein